MTWPSFESYKKVINNNHWPLYAWTGHALVLSSLYIILLIVNIQNNVLAIISSTLLILTGGGLILLNLAHLIENKRMIADKYIKWYYVTTSHLIILIIGTFLLFNLEKTNISDLISSYILLLSYFLVMSTKLDSPWILYNDSKFSKETRKKLILVSIAVVFFVIPLFIFL